MKGYYKRAKAHAAVWNEKEARRDFNMVAHLDVTLASLIHRELKALSERMKEKYWEEKETYWNKLEKNDDEEESQAVEDKGETEGEVMEEKSHTLSGDVLHGGEECVAAATEGTRDGQDASETRMEGKDWQQMLRLVMLLQDEGNFLIKENHFEEASAKFQEAADYVDVLQKKASCVM